jgi:hypothetical protein
MAPLHPRNRNRNAEGKTRIIPDMTGGFALCLPNHVSQLGGDRPNLCIYLNQATPRPGVRRGKCLHDLDRILAGHPQELRAVIEG